MKPKNQINTHLPSMQGFFDALMIHKHYKLEINAGIAYSEYRFHRKNAHVIYHSLRNLLDHVQNKILKS